MPRVRRPSLGQLLRDAQRLEAAAQFGRLSFQRNRQDDDPFAHAAKGRSVREGREALRLASLGWTAGYQEAEAAERDTPAQSIDPAARRPCRSVWGLTRTEERKRTMRKYGFCFRGEGCAACLGQRQALVTSGSTQWLRECMPPQYMFSAYVENGAGYTRYFRRMREAKAFASSAGLVAVSERGRRAMIANWIAASAQ